MARWEELDPETQKQLAMQMMQGQAPTPQNLNRANQALSSNPNLLSRLMQQAGLDDAAVATEDAEVSGQDIQARLLAGDEESQAVGEANADAVSDTGEEDMPASVDDLDEDEVQLILDYREGKKKQNPQMPGANARRQAVAEVDDDE